MEEETLPPEPELLIAIRGILPNIRTNEYDIVFEIYEYGESKAVFGIELDDTQTIMLNRILEPVNKQMVENIRKFFKKKNIPIDELTQDELNQITKDFGEIYEPE